MNHDDPHSLLLGGREDAVSPLSPSSRGRRPVEVCGRWAGCGLQGRSVPPEEVLRDFFRGWRDHRFVRTVDTHDVFYPQMTQMIADEKPIELIAVPPFHHRHAVAAHYRICSLGTAFPVAFLIV